MRSDYGLENVGVANWMIVNMGISRGSHITGSSVHNQRIERLWREVNRIVTRVYKNVFYYLETEHVLDPLNDVDLYCLHKVYIPRINHSLQEFRRQFNHHPVRTEHNLSPHQLFVSGLLANRSDTASRNLFEDFIDPSRYGIEEEGPVPNLDETEGVVVPPIMLTTPPSLSQEYELEREIGLVEDTDVGTSQYLRARQVMQQFEPDHTV